MDELEELIIREKLKRITENFVGIEADKLSNMEMIVAILDEVTDDIYWLRDHSHTIS